MSDRLRELAERQAALQIRCAAQRRTVAREVRAVETRLRTIDRIAAVARGTLLHPVVVAGGIAAMLVLGRSGALRLLGRGLLLAAAARRLLRAAKKL